MKPRHYKHKVNHKAIHTEQKKELCFISFYLFYFAELLYYLVKKRNWKKACRSISFEREAFANQSNYNYLEKREPFAQWKK